MIYISNRANSTREPENHYLLCCHHPGNCLRAPQQVALQMGHGPSTDMCEKHLGQTREFDELLLTISLSDPPSMQA
ncbi:hypothetical protein VTK26DRAFT_5064 [Humicola hyalothermophila]